jgi:antitoxin YefM
VSPLDIAYVITYHNITTFTNERDNMATITASEARSKLYRLIDETAASHQPILITGKRTNAVLVSEDDWRAIQETVYLLSIPGMRESIREGLDASIEECAKELDW